VIREDGQVAVRYVVQHKFEGKWIDDSERYVDPGEAKAELARQRSLWGDEYRVVRIKMKVMDW
jgi:hypothetical protein